MDSVSELFNAGLSVTLFGMGVVFFLLTLLVGIVHAMSAFSRLFPQDVAETASTSDMDAELISVIGAAIHQYRSKRSIDE